MFIIVDRIELAKAANTAEDEYRNFDITPWDELASTWQERYLAIVDAVINKLKEINK